MDLKSQDKKSQIDIKSIKDLHQKYKNQELNPVDALKAVYNNISDPDCDKLGKIFSYVPEYDQFLQQAKQSQQRFEQKQNKGLLDGIPVSIKDGSYHVKGMPSRNGSILFNNNPIDQEDCPIVEKLKNAGAIIVGRTTMPEYGWKWSCSSKLYGTLRNPLDINRTPGGSTGGGVVALNKQMCTITMGSDGAGSIRMPAACVGLVGFKPSRQFVAKESPSDVGHCGPIANSVEDIAIVMDVIAGQDYRDFNTLLCPKKLQFYQGCQDILNSDLSTCLKGINIAYSSTLDGIAKYVNPEMEKIIQEVTFDIFKKLGSNVVKTDPQIKNLDS